MGLSFWTETNKVGSMNFFNFFKKGDANDSRRINSDIFIAKRDEDILNIRSAFFNVINRQDVLTDTIKILMAMADKQEFIYMSGCCTAIILFSSIDIPITFNNCNGCFVTK